MFIEPTITWVPSGFSGYIWLDVKMVLKIIRAERAVKLTANRFAINRESASRIDGDTQITKVDRPWNLNSINRN